MIDPVEHARLQAVEDAIKAELAKPGHITRTELIGALAAVPPPAGEHGHATPWVADEPWR